MTEQNPYPSIGLMAATAIEKLLGERLILKESVPPSPGVCVVGADSDALRSDGTTHPTDRERVTFVIRFTVEGPACSSVFDLIGSLDPFGVPVNASKGKPFVVKGYETFEVRK